MQNSFRAWIIKIDLEIIQIDSESKILSSLFTITRRSVENSPIMTKNVIIKNKFQSIIFKTLMKLNTSDDISINIQQLIDSFDVDHIKQEKNFFFGSEILQPLS